ncbi:MAG TPA: hypothetical protein VFS66_01720 [Acidimicrobiia bacterium]|nr:hypothetical protein [Acidimicrobiia bacterium]
MRRYAILAYGAIGTMADVGLMVLGSLLVGLAVAVLLGGFGLVDVTADDLSTGEMLISAIVLAVVGLFCLGVAAEGPLGRGRRLVGFKVWEVGIGRTLAVFAVGLVGLLLYDFIGGQLEDVPSPLYKGAEGFRAVGIAGMTVMPLLGVPLSLLVRSAPDAYAWVRQGEIPVMFTVWAISAMVILT